MKRYPKNLILTSLLATSTLAFQGTPWAMDGPPPVPAQNVPEEVSPEEYERRVDEFLSKLNTDGKFNKKINDYKKNIIDIKSLDIRVSRLTSLPKEIGNLTALTMLCLSNNKLTHFPKEIDYLTALTYLDLHNNQLTSLSQGIANLNALTYLDLNKNQLTSLPKEIGNLTALINLHLNNNQLSSLPKEIGNLTALANLHIENSQLTSVPKEIGDLPNIRFLNLENNPLLPRGENENMWGREELRRHFGDRVLLDDPQAQKPMPANTTLDQVYQNLDSQPLYIRPVAKGVKFLL